MVRASTGGTGRSNTSPETITRSTDRASAISATSDRTASNSAVRSWRPSRRPTCQSEVWRMRMEGAARSEPLEGVSGCGGIHLLLAGGPGGNGKVTTSGTGIAGCETTMVPGLRRRARARVDGSIQPYSARSASAASRRPATRIAAFSSTSDATRDAVCWAPTRSTPSDRPRCAMSISMSFSGPVPSRGAYLLSSSSTITERGSRWPEASFSRKVSLSRAPTTNRCAWSCRDWMATTVTLARARSIRRLSPARTR